MINDPLLILADEPTGNLDSRSSEEIIELLHSLHDQGKTIVVVTHDLDVALHTQRIIMVRDGKVYSDKENDHPSQRAEGQPVLEPSIASVEQSGVL